ncbi:hypothetical protein BJD99_04920 [Rhodococcus sp. 1163]|uniref:cupin domain-containing protein n=1 Tax=unclassified Rhodococcus (in: high G+C Gram-positive bacteria) TaxID=192944 RepID=UPI0009FD3C9B|nr:cupin domain-containing protein [Rhodococcus sp. 1163]ORI19514.1 hypothetical protein BJD99_04920 [Rhodococcus sp. 1163]
MPTITSSATRRFELHGSVFTSYVSPTTSASTELCGWMLDVAPHTPGAEHTVSNEEVLLVLSGLLTVHIDGVATVLGPGDVAQVPAKSSFRVQTEIDSARVWVATTVGMSAELPDGSTLTPPWAR